MLAPSFQLAWPNATGKTNNNNSVPRKGEEEEGRRGVGVPGTLDLLSLFYLTTTTHDWKGYYPFLSCFFTLRRDGKG
jgi:hypothetical protein